MSCDNSLPDPSPTEPSDVDSCSSTREARNVFKTCVRSLILFHERLSEHQALPEFTTPRDSSHSGEELGKVPLFRMAVFQKFCFSHPPEISIDDYVERIHRYCPLSAPVYIAASVYVYRICYEQNNPLPLSRCNVHCFVLASLRVAAKCLEDMSHSQSAFSKSGGITSRELTVLESGLLYLIGFNLSVDQNRIDRHYGEVAELSQRIASSCPLQIPEMRVGLTSKDGVGLPKEVIEANGQKATAPS